MKNRLLIVTRRFYPHGDATSSVLENFINELKKYDVYIHVMSLTSYKEDEEVRCWGDIKITNVYVPETMDLQQLRSELDDSLISWITVFKYIIDKIKTRFLPSCRKYSLDHALLKGFKKLFNIIKNKNEYDLCLVTLMPHEALWVMRWCKNRIPYVVYQLDAYWNNSVYPPKYTKYRKNLEIDIINSSLFTLTTPLVYKSLDNYTNELMKKLVPVEFPLITETEVDDFEYDDGLTHCVFLGTLYPTIRPPEKIVSIVAEIKEKYICFDFYGRKLNLIESASKYEVAKNIINIKGTIESELAKTVRNKADVLVNIDNTNLTQVPSKIFEYISTGKPIINFYFDDRSPILDYLKLYPLSLSINVNSESYEKSAQRIVDFINEKAHSRLLFDQTKSIFYKCTPEYVVVKFINMMKENDVWKDG